MRVIVIELDTTGTTIKHPGDFEVKRGENVAWVCEDFGFDVLFKVPGSHPPAPGPHPFAGGPANGHLVGPALTFVHNEVRKGPGSPLDGTSFTYHIKVTKGPGSVIELDPVIIVNGDK